MQDRVNSTTNDEIDLREAFLILWAYKLFIAFMIVLGIICSGYYALTAEKKYRSVAVFKLDSQESGGFALGGQLGALARLGGVMNMDTSGGLEPEQVSGRIFIQKLDKKLNFKADRYFNTYNPNSVEPLLKSWLKSVVGWQSSPVDDQEAMWQGIVATFSDHVSIDDTSVGSVKVIVNHENALRAAEIANAIMLELISMKETQKRTAVDEKLSYLSSTLVEALSAMELSQSKLKEFALENSALPLQDFSVGSLELDALREQMSRTTELHEAVAALLYMLQHSKADESDYISLREQFPVVDQVEFRRVLGQNEIITSWTWPEIRSVKVVLDTLTERKVRLRSQIKAAQQTAEGSARVLEAFAKLEREAKVAEAAYTVLIEQVKAQSVVSGFQPNNSEIYEYASPAIGPSEPKRNLLLALGAVLGLFFGIASSLLFALWRGVYYSKHSLQAGAQASLMTSARPLMPLRNKSLNEVEGILKKNPLSTLRNLVLEVNKSGAELIIMTSSRAKLRGIDVARALACYMQHDGTTIAIINFSERSKKLDVMEERPSVGSFIVSEIADRTSILRPDEDLLALEFLSRRDFLNNVQSLNSTYDLVFLCADDDDAISLLSVLERQKTLHIMLARIKRTRSRVLTTMGSLIPIRGLLYD